MAQKFPVEVRKGETVRQAKNPRQLVQFQFDGYTAVTGDETAAPKGAFGRGSNPDDYNASEVADFLKTLDLDNDDDAAEYDRIQSAEAAGQGRKTIVG